MDTTPRLLILENDPRIYTAVASALAQSDWEITRAKTPDQTLERLTQTAESRPFALLIFSVHLPDTEVDTLLQRARQASPATQRLLLVDRESSDTLISAINKSFIHACMTLPFQDNDFREQARACMTTFNHLRKRTELKQLTDHQNKKLFHLARKLKKDEEQLAATLKAKENRLAALQAATPPPEEDAATRLVHRMGLDNTTIDVQGFSIQFHRMSQTLKAAFDQLAQSHGLDPVARPTAFSPGAEPPRDEKIQELLNLLYTLPPLNTDSDDHPTWVKLEIAPDGMSAALTRVPPGQGSPIPDLQALTALIDQHKITQGLIPQAQQQGWLDHGDADVPTLILARGRPPEPDRPGRIEYAFATDYSNPGKIQTDGSIDFRERGDIPHVQAGTLLARRHPPEPGHPGMDIHGTEVPPPPAEEPVFLAGDGAELSETETEIHAAMDGQPGLDPLGRVTVSPELIIEGDVDFETGNIDYKGNVVVNGCINQGFSVRCINLTAQDIQGAEILVKGDLSVSSGINDSRVSARGNVFCKTINNSQIRAFGDLLAQTEVIDADIMVTGMCWNGSGRIVSSRISALAGIEANRIGTETSEPCRLRVGVEDHGQWVLDEQEALLQASVAELKKLKQKIRELEEEDRKLDEETCRQNQLEKIDAETARARLGEIFEIQHRNAGELAFLRLSIKQVEDRNQRLVLAKQAIREYIRIQDAKASLEALGKIAAGTRIQGRGSLLVLEDALAGCKIQEVTREEEGRQYLEMVIS